jgi:SAM-dependent methyltransferase
MDWTRCGRFVVGGRSRGCNRSAVLNRICYDLFKPRRYNKVLRASWLSATTHLGEYIYVAKLDEPNLIYRHLNRLAYDVLAGEYRLRGLAPGPNQEAPPYLADLLLRKVTSPDRILELGPGPGDVLRELSKHARQMLAIELSPQMAEIAAESAPSATVIIADIMDVDFPTNSFDGIYAGAFFHLFPEREAKDLIRKAAGWLKPDGAMFLNTSVQDEQKASIEIKSDYIIKVARYRSRWSEDFFRSIIEDAGLRIVDRATTNETERSKYWVAFICRKISGA